jgi:hypothetical protein
VTRKVFHRPLTPTPASLEIDDDRTGRSSNP